MSPPRSLASLVPGVTRAAVGRNAGALGTLMADWGAVVGDGWAARAVPEGLTFPRGRQDGATLKLRVDPADALMLQHDLGALTDRINRHFGYAAVARITMIQAPIRREKPAPALRKPTGAEISEIDAAVTAVTDEEWRLRLASLGRAVYARTVASLHRGRRMDRRSTEQE